MLELLFNIFILPLEFAMKTVLQGIYFRTDNPSLALICVSLIVTLGSLPLYHIAEKWQDKERSIQKKMKPKIREFKSMFKGAALNAYLSTLYRQNNYHPVYAVRATFGLLVQIPFFFAAYHLLSNYAGFDGVESFLFRDLGKPDELLRIGSVTINIMPFAMTAINLVSASVYGKKISMSEKVQLYGMAGIFLVVLYNSPSALLFYWTFNNIFSLLKNVAYRFLYADGKIQENVSATKSSIFPRLERLDRLGPPRWTRVNLVVAAFVLHFGLPAQMDLESPLTFICLSAGYIILGLLLFFSCVHEWLHGEKRTRIFKTGVYGVSVSIGVVGLVLWVFGIKEDVFYLDLSLYMLWGTFLFDLIVHLFAKLSMYIENNGLVIEKSRGRFFCLALLNLGMLLFLVGPITLLSSSGVEDFDHGLSSYLPYMLMLLTVFCVVVSMGFYFVRPAAQTLIVYVLTVLSLSTIINIVVFPSSYGDMSLFKFHDGLAIDAVSNLLNILCLFAVVGLSIWIIKSNRGGVFKPVLTVVFISLVALSVKESYSYHRFKEENKEDRVAAAGFDSAFTFSKTKENVVIIMLDRFIGGYVTKALELMPELKDVYDGFVWYPDTHTDGSYTVAGVASILGGWDYHIHEMNNTRTDVKLRTKLDESARILPYNFDKVGFQSSVYGRIPGLKTKNKEHLKNTRVRTLRGDYLDMWKAENNITFDSERTQEVLAMFGLFRSAPTILREQIYEDGRWNLGGKEPEKEIRRDTHISFHETAAKQLWRAAKNYSTLDCLPELSTASDAAPGQFYFLSSMFTHDPYFTTEEIKIDLSNRIYYPKSIYNEFEKDLFSVQHLYTDTAALRVVGDWIEWMKKNNVYDNTRIVIVSDHGKSVYNPILASQKIKVSKKARSAAMFYGLLMVKDFHSRGPFETNSKPMTINDVPYLAMKDIVQGTNPYTGTPIVEKTDKFPYHSFFIYWKIRDQGKYKYKIREGYVIPADATLDPSKWTRSNVK